jgi:hypothetical protein
MKVFTRTSKENKRLENNRGASEIIREGHIGEGARPGLVVWGLERST